MDTSIVTLGKPCVRLCARVRASLTASTQICDFCFRTRIRARGQRTPQRPRHIFSTQPDGHFVCLRLNRGRSRGNTVESSASSGLLGHYYSSFFFFASDT